MNTLTSYSPATGFLADETFLAAGLAAVLVAVFLAGAAFFAGAALLAVLVAAGWRSVRRLD
jgi:hypothetical protein